MRFRPCIDIHNGKVKQIIGGSLKDAGDIAKENFVSEQDARYYAELYKKNNIRGGHIILLNAPDSEYYDETKEQALMALEAYRGGLQIGGGINDKNARFYLEVGASHVIVTSFVFNNGELNSDNFARMLKVVGKNHLVLDLSCRKRDNNYYIVTDRWQKFTNLRITPKLLEKLSLYCDEFLIHAVDVEGKAQGIDDELVSVLAQVDNSKITYAGGIGSIEDINKLKEISDGKIDFTVGSALDIFGGNLKFDEIIRIK